MSKPNTRSARRSALLTVVLGCAAAVAGVAPAYAAPVQETAVAPEKNPPGDIPDDQVFITYKSPLNFTIKVPEGWARTDRPNGVSFADKYGRVDVEIRSGPAPTAASVRSGDAAALEQNGHAVKIGSIKDVALPSGAAVRIVYTSNSEPNPVTNKRLRLENERTVIGHDGKIAVVTLSAPAGADNADQWKLMNESFRWQ